MRRSDETLFMPAPVWDDPRLHLLDDLWLLTTFAILFAVALPWFVSAFDIDFAGAALGLLALGAVHLGFTAVSSPKRGPIRWRTRALGALHAVGVLALGFVWLHAGGLQNPMFLVVFTLPVVGAIFISRWQPYAIGALAILVVISVALLQAPELRWYATGLNGAGAWIARIFGSAPTTLAAPFPGFYAPSGYFIVLLEVFAVLTFACAIAAEHLGSVFERLYAHVTMARAEAERGQELWAALIEHIPLPAVLVDADTHQIICASDQLAASYCNLDSEVLGMNLFETVRFSYPEVVQELIVGFGGTAPLAMIRVGGELRISEVRVQHVAQKGRRFALVIIEDTTEQFCVRAALDCADHAALILDSQGRVLSFNKQAVALFPQAESRLEASGLLRQVDLPPNWWDAGLAGRRRMHVEIGPRMYQLTVSSVTLPGEEEHLHVIGFLPVAKVGTAEYRALSATAITSTRIQP